MSSTNGDANSVAYGNEYNKRIDRLGIVFVITSALLGFGGFMLYRRPGKVSEVESIHEPPAKFALRALKYATLITLTGAGVLVMSFCYFLDIWSFKEFNSLMIEKISPISKKIDTAFPKVLIYQRGVLKNENLMQFRNESEDCFETKKD